MHNPDSELKNVQINYYQNVELDLDPENYPKKYQIFVGELKTIIENILLSNEMIDGVNYSIKTLDDNVRLVLCNLRELANSLRL